MKAVLNIAGMILAALHAIAADAALPINIIFSADNASCAAWSKSAGNKLIRAQYEFWARGFVSGHNYANPSHQIKVGAVPGGDELYQYFDQFCGDNPQQTFVGGAIQLVEQLRAPPAKSAPAVKPAAKAAAPAK